MNRPPLRRSLRAVRSGVLIRMIICVALWAGCASSASQSPDGGGADAPKTGDSTGDTVADSAADQGGSACPPAPDLTTPTSMCNTLPNSAQAVAFTARAGTAPAPAGGVLVDGVYVSTMTEGYGPITGNGRRITLAVVGGGKQMYWVGEILDETGATVIETFTINTHIAPSGSQIAFTVDCTSISPPPIPSTLSYTATPDTLILALAMPSAGTTSVTTYTRMGCLP